MSTGLTDIIKPSYVAGYMEAVFPDILPFAAAGAVALDFEAVTAGEGGDFVTVPTILADTTAAEKNDGTDTVTLGKIQSYKDVAAISRRKRPRGVDGVVKDALGENSSELINNAIAQSEAPYWALESQKALLSVAKGVFDDTAGVLKDSHRLVKGKTTGTTPVPISVNHMIDAASLMGDNIFGIAAIAMHSKVYADFEKDAQGRIVVPQDGPLAGIPFFNGRPIIVSDLCVKRGTTPLTIYQTYLVKAGAFWLSISRAPKFWYSVEARGPREVLTTTLSMVAHLKGVKWNVSTTNAQNSDYETATNWAHCVIEGTSTKIDNRLIGIACLETNSTLG